MSLAMRLIEQTCDLFRYTEFKKNHPIQSVTIEKLGIQTHVAFLNQGVDMAISYQ